MKDTSAGRAHGALGAVEGSSGKPASFGRYIRSIREGEGLTQGDFADRLGISVQHLSNVENCRKHVSIERAAAWARSLGYAEAPFVQLSLQDQFQRVGLEGYQLTVKRAS